MNAMKKVGRDPKEILGVVRQQGLPALGTDADKEGTAAFNLRAKISSMKQIEKEAKKRGLTMKQLVMQALKADGVDVSHLDLEDRSPSKMRKWR
jgi:hypothetical protein